MKTTNAITKVYNFKKLDCCYMPKRGFMCKKNHGGRGPNGPNGPPSRLDLL